MPEIHGCNHDHACKMSSQTIKYYKFMEECTFVSVVRTDPSYSQQVVYRLFLGYLLLVDVEM